MKILFSTFGLKEDYKNHNLLGTESQVFGLAKELVKQGNDVYILRRWKSIAKMEVIEGIKIINVKSPKIFDPTPNKLITQLLFSCLIKKEIEKISPDVLNLTSRFASYSTSKLDIPKVYTTHNLPIDLFPTEMVPLRGLGKYVIRKFEFLIYENCDNVCALNKDISEYLIKNDLNTGLIPNGIDLKNYVPNFSEENYIMFGGRLSKEKGVNFLLEAYSKLDNTLQEKYKLLIVGSGPEQENLVNLCSKLEIEDRTEFVPWLKKKDLIKKILNCTVFVLPSLFECMPVVLLEAMACSKPVIATNIPGSKDIIVNGMNGFLFENKNSNELKICLEELLENKNLRKKIAKKARETIEEEYTFKKVADNYIKIFKELVSV